MCGGTETLLLRCFRWRGLSPRVRGNLVRPACYSIVNGSIPACAGEPPGDVRRAALVRVYPRVCGGTLNAHVPSALCRGLSPRVRGNLALPGPPALRHRSIPACAGAPPSFRFVLFDPWVYPRVCGGTYTPPRRVGVQAGSIPACAGEPNGQVGHNERPRVYPRVCGGTPCPVPLHLRLAGLSPRVRGNQVVIDSEPMHIGSIPACAGEPRLQPSCLGERRVYPRVCGGTGPYTTRIKTSDGLSPRVRGNPLPASTCALCVGSIPACAGEPLPCA